MKSLVAVRVGFRMMAVAGLIGAAAIPAGPAQAQAGQVNSIVVQAFDSVTGLPIDLGAKSTALYNNAQIRLITTAYDSMGNALPCSPRPTERAGVGGSNLSFGRPRADGSVLMTAGSGFGSTEIIPGCQEYPNFAAKPIYTSVIAQGTNLGTAQAGLGLRRVPPTTATAPEGTVAPGKSTSSASARAPRTSHAGVITGVIVGGALAVGAIAYGLSGVAGSSSGGGGGSCPTYSDYCPNGAGNGGGVRQSGCSCPGGTNTATCGSSNNNCGGLYPAGTVLCNC